MEELDEHDLTCSCPGARERRHRAGKPREGDPTFFYDCACVDCTKYFEENATLVSDERK